MTMDLDLKTLTGPDFFLPELKSISDAGNAEISSEAVGGKVLSVSDEFFVEAFHLLMVQVNNK